MAPFICETQTNNYPKSVSQSQAFGTYAYLGRVLYAVRSVRGTAVTEFPWLTGGLIRS